MKTLEIFNSYEDNRESMKARLEKGYWTELFQDCMEFLTIEQIEKHDLGKKLFNFESFIEEMPSIYAVKLIELLIKKEELVDFIGSSDRIFNALSKHNLMIQEAMTPSLELSKRLKIESLNLPTYEPVCLEMEEVRQVLPTVMKYYPNPDNSSFHVSFPMEKESCFIGFKIRTEGEDKVLIATSATAAGEEVDYLLEQAIDGIKNLVRKQNSNVEFEIERTLAS